MPSEELWRIERDGMRLVLSCCGAVGSHQCEEGAGQILMQSLIVGGGETGMCLDLTQISEMADALHTMTARIVAGKSKEEQILRYAREVSVLDRRMEEILKALDALEKHESKEEATDGAGT